LRPIRWSTASTSAITAEAIFERFAHRAFGVGQRRQALIGGIHLALVVLDLGGRLDEGGAQAGVIGFQRFDIRLDAPALLLGGAHRILEATQLRFARGLVVGLGGLRQRRLSESRQGGENKSRQRYRPRGASCEREPREGLASRHGGRVYRGKAYQQGFKRDDRGARRELSARGRPARRP
jgi:hypothetical protein